MIKVEFHVRTNEGTKAMKEAKERHIRDNKGTIEFSMQSEKGNAVITARPESGVVMYRSVLQEMDIPFTEKPY